MKDKRRKKLEALKSDFERSAQEQYFESFDGSKLRILSFIKTKEPPATIEILFIPGLLTIFPRWEKVVKELNKWYIVHYVESREKFSSILPKRATMRLEEIRKDLVFAIKNLGLQNKRYITISSSMGGAMILENLATGELTPLDNILISPGVEFPFPKWIRPLLHVLPPFVMTMIKPFIRWYLRTFTVDSKKEPEQAKQYIRAVNEAEMRKLRRWILKNANKYNGWHLLPKIHGKVVVIGASTDKTHKSDFTKRVAEALPNSRYIDLGTNKAAHDMPLVDLTKTVIEELESELKKK
ncbi:MAG: hypothetical protein ACTSV6_03405 [Candidatus Heimdallarchaeota archaeon]